MSANYDDLDHVNSRGFIYEIDQMIEDTVHNTSKVLERAKSQLNTRLHQRSQVIGGSFQEQAAQPVCLTPTQPDKILAFSKSRPVIQVYVNNRNGNKNGSGLYSRNLLSKMENVIYGQQAVMRQVEKKNGEEQLKGINRQFTNSQLDQQIQYRPVKIEISQETKNQIEKTKNLIQTHMKNRDPRNNFKKPKQNSPLRPQIDQCNRQQHRMKNNFHQNFIILSNQSQQKKQQEAKNLANLWLFSVKDRIDQIEEDLKRGKFINSSNDGHSFSEDELRILKSSWERNYFEFILQAHTDLLNFVGSAHGNAMAIHELDCNINDDVNHSKELWDESVKQFNILVEEYIRQLSKKPNCPKKKISRGVMKVQLCNRILK